MNKIIKYVFYDILRSRTVMGYTLLLLVLSTALFSLANNATSGVINLLHVMLIAVPLISVVFTTMHYYQSYEFMELLLAQPVRRRSVLLGQLLGVSIALSAAWLVGAGLPMILLAPSAAGLSLLVGGWLLTLAFVALAFFTSVSTQDKARGIGVSLMLWLAFALLYDGLVLMLLFTFSDYPLEKAMLPVASLNPIDLTRIFVMLQTDASALMGYTGAVYKDFFGTIAGIFYCVFVLVIWNVVPVLLSLRVFVRKDV